MVACTVVPATWEAEAGESLEPEGRGCSEPSSHRCTSVWRQRLRLRKKKKSGGNPFLSPLLVFVRFVEDPMVVDVWCYSWGLLLFHWSIYLFWYQYHAVLVTVALLYNLKSSSMMPPALFFLCTIILALWALFWFHMKFKVVFPNSAKKVNGSLMGVALNL